MEEKRLNLRSIILVGVLILVAIFLISRNNGLQETATDPTTVQLTSGRIQFVEFFSRV